MEKGDEDEEEWGEREEVGEKDNVGAEAIDRWTGTGTCSFMENDDDMCGHRKFVCKNLDLV